MSEQPIPSSKLPRGLVGSGKAQLKGAYPAPLLFHHDDAVDGLERIVPVLTFLLVLESLERQIDIVLLIIFQDAEIL